MIELQCILRRLSCLPIRQEQLMVPAAWLAEGSEEFRAALMKGLEAQGYLCRSAVSTHVLFIKESSKGCVLT